MDETLRGESGRRSTAAKSRVSKFLAGGVAVVGVGAIAASPISPVIDTEVKVQQQSVALTAAANPLTLLQQFFGETQTNLEYLGLNNQLALRTLTAAFETADPLGEVGDILLQNVSNPQPFITRLLQSPEVYGAGIQVALFGQADDPTTTVNENYDGVLQRLQEAITEFGPTAQDILTHDDPTQGPLTNALYEANLYFVLNVLDILRPLTGTPNSPFVPLFSIPGDFLGGEVAGGFVGALPGVDRFDNLINVFNEQTLTRAVIGPFQTVAFQLAASVETALAAFESEDYELAATELANLPIRAVNAFVNGFAPNFSPDGAEWPSLIDVTQQQSGLFKYLAWDLPNQITGALGGTPPPAVVAPPAPTAGTGGELTKTTDAPQGTVDPAGAPAPQTDQKEQDADDISAKLVSDTEVPATGDEQSLIEVDAKSTTSTSTKKAYKFGDGLKKVSDDVSNGIKKFTDPWKPKKKESQPSTSASTTTTDDTETSDDTE